MTATGGCAWGFAGVAGHGRDQGGAVQQGMLAGAPDFKFGEAAGGGRCGACNFAFAAGCCHHSEVEAYSLCCNDLGGGEFVPLG